VKRTIGHRRGLFWYILLPTMVISSIIGIYGAEPPDTVHDVHYVNLDQGELGQHVIREVSRTRYYRLHSVESADRVKELVMNRKANTTFVIPADFTQSLWSGKTGGVDMYQLNSTIVNRSLKTLLDQAVKGTAEAVQHVKSRRDLTEREAEALLLSVLAEQEKHKISAKVTDEQLYIRPNATRLSEINGLILLFIMGIISKAVILIAEDRAQKTMARIFTAPVRAMEIAIGNFLGCFAMGTLQILLMLLVTRCALQFNYGISFLHQLLILECFLLASLGIACAAASLVKEIHHLENITMMIIIPTCMLGGCFWSVNIMPEFLQKLANFMPQKWAIDAIENLKDGETILQQSMPLAILLLFALVFLSFGSYMLQPNERETG
jgi:ABC-2 type transport system permease protein